jgi:hypothetical protein
MNAVTGARKSSSLIAAPLMAPLLLAAIQLLAKMDPRVKPAGDDGNDSIRPKHAPEHVPIE